MKIKKWKAGRKEKEGVVQVRLRNVNGKVVLEEVDVLGERAFCGSILQVGAEGLSLFGSFESRGIAVNSGKIKLLNGEP